MNADDAEAMRKRSLPPDLRGETPQHLAVALKERVYATFTGLAIVLVLGGHEPTPTAATYSLAIGVLGITIAGFVADIVAHLAAHAEFPAPDEMRRMLRVAAGGLTSAGVPVIVLLLSWPGWISIDTALRIATIVYIATLGLIGYIAVRRTALAWWIQLLALLALMLLGIVVIAVQTLAHDA